jgi:hypothetical protein
VDEWLSALNEDEEAADRILLLAEIGEKWPRADAVDLLSMAIETVVENYRA